MSTTPEAVRELLKSEDFGQRLSAVVLIRQLEPTIAFELIQIAINDPNTRVRYSAVSQLASLGNHDKAIAQEILRDRLINDPESDVQAAAADAIGALKFTDAFDDLAALYHQNDQWLVRFSIIAALGELGDPKAFDLLEEALASDESLIKTAAIGSLGELGDIRAVPLLIPYATADDWQIRHRVVQALGHLQHPDARQVVEKLVNDTSEPVAQEARHQLSK